jgi:Family of unknown function (DUF5999)
MSGNGVNGGGRRHLTRGTCGHTPVCPSAQSAGRLAARVVCDHLEQGWELLCNGVVLFDDAGALLPDGRTLAPVVLRVAARVGANA